MARDFVAKTLLDTTRVIEQSVFQMELATENGLLQGLDPRAKLLSCLLLLVLAASSRSFIPLLFLYTLCLLFAFFSRIPLSMFLKRVWIFVPLFTGIVAFPAIFNFVTPGDTVFTLIALNGPLSIGPFTLPEEISITKQGLLGAGLLVLRVAVSVSLAILLVLSTRWMDLLQALSVLRVPGIVIVVLEMTYRYIHLFLRSLEGMLVARKSRQLAPAVRREEQGWISSRLGVLVAKSYHLSEDVHVAMVSRGWSGSRRLLSSHSFRLKDKVAVTVSGLFFISLIIFDKFF